MTMYKFVSIFIGTLALMMSFGSLIIVLLAFSDKRNKRIGIVRKDKSFFGASTFGVGAFSIFKISLTNSEFMCKF